MNKKLFNRPRFSGWPLVSRLSVLMTITFGADTLFALESWNMFRGANMSHISGKNLPLVWQTRGGGGSAESEKKGWRIRLEGYGQSSPVVWNDRVFVTSVSGDNKETCHLAAYRVTDGELVWEREFPATQRVADSDTVSRGAPTPIVDDQGVYAVFESGDVFALDHAGIPLWNLSFVSEFGEIKGPHGYASSPLLVGDQLIVQVAHSGPSYILSLDRKSGETRWRVDHPSQTGWSSPAAYVHAKGTSIIISTSGSVSGLNAENGDLQWRIDGLQGNSTASPTIAGDLLVIGSGGERGGSESRAKPGSGQPRGDKLNGSEKVKIDKPSDSKEGENDEDIQMLNENAGSPGPGTCVIKLDYQNDASKASILWRSPKLQSGYASPVVDGDLMYVVNKSGVAQCVDIKSGQVYWKHRLPSQAWATPGVCNGCIVFFCKDGSVLTVRSSNELEEVGESSVSTTDIVYGWATDEVCWFVRSGRGLTCIR